jgi:hypothetical protein
MSSLLPNLIEKQRIIFVDNVSSEFAEEYSKIYENAVFFTNDNEIWKGGKLFSKIIGIDESSNSIVINGTTYRLVIESNLLKFKTDMSWNWYVTANRQTFSIPAIELQDTDSELEGWRFITNDIGIIDSNIQTLQYNPFYAEFDPATQKFNVDIDNMKMPPIYSRHYISKEIVFDEQDFLVNGETNIYLVLPYDLVVKYEVGLYDDLGETNFLPPIGTQSGNGEYRADKPINEGGIQYITYKITLRKDKHQITKPFKSFNLNLYSKTPYGINND